MSDNHLMDFTDKIMIEALETEEAFIFKNIKPFCEKIVELTIQKKDLEEALIKHFQKSRIYDNGNWFCPSCFCQVHGDQKYCDFCGQHMEKIET